MTNSNDKLIWGTDMKQRGRLLLTAQGLNTKEGYQLIKRQLHRETLSRKRIYVFYEPYYSIEVELLNACQKLGFSRDNIILSSQANSASEIKKVNYIYVTEGNTFHILKLLQERKLLQPIREAVLAGACYIGASAGAVIAGRDIAIAGLMDENEVELEDLQALGLVDGGVCPHMSKRQLHEMVRSAELDGLMSYNKIYAIAEGRILCLKRK